MSGMKMSLPKTTASSVMVVGISALVLVLMVGVVASMAKSKSDSNSNKGKSQNCAPPDVWHGLVGWHHGNEISLVPPWSCTHPTSGKGSGSPSPSPSPSTSPN